jgi:predicted amidohydrolase YtcJ
MPACPVRNGTVMHGALLRTLQRALVALALALASAAHAAGADLVLEHGHIWTGNPRMPWAESMAISGGRIAAIGTDRMIGRRVRGARQVVDLHGRTVIPGIVDSHLHMLFGAYALHGLNLSTPEASITPDRPDELIARLRAYAAEHPRDAVIFVRADFSATPPSTPDRELLDRAVPDRPVVVHNSTEHSLWVNSAALRLAGITDYPVADPREERGVIRDASGHPSGILLEAAMELVERAVVAHVPESDRLAMVEAAAHYLNRYGITAVVNATGDLDEMRLYATLRDRGSLAVRTRTAYGAVAVAHRLSPQFLTEIETARASYHDDWVSANLVKFFADGFSGLIPPLVYEPHAYAEIVTELDRRGFQIMTHAARNDSVHMILDTYQQLPALNGERDRRLRIEHADLTDAADLPRFALLGVTVVMQPSFCCAQIGLNYDAAHMLPTDRWRSFLAQGTALAFASDWPCTFPPDPFLGMQQAVTRDVWHSADTAGIAGNPFDGAGQGGAVRTGGSYLPEERISVDAALSAYTLGSARAAFFDDRVGTLEVGKLADLAVLSQDIFTVPAQSIAATRVLMTMVGGRVVYQQDP